MEATNTLISGGEATSGAGTTLTILFDHDDTTSSPSDPPTSPRFTIGYWSIRGLGAPLRMMLCAARVNHTVVLYDIVEDCDTDESAAAWRSDYFDKAKPMLKEKYKAPLLNLPFVVDHDANRIVSQSNACFSYLGRHCNMMGQNEREQSECEELLCEIYDLRNIMVQFSYSKSNVTANGDDETKDHDAIVKAAQTKDATHALDRARMGSLKKLEHWLDHHQSYSSSTVTPSHRCHLVGGVFSAPDFHLFEMLDQFDGLARYYDLGDALEGYPFLRQFKEGFAALE